MALAQIRINLDNLAEFERQLEEFERRRGPALRAAVALLALEMQRRAMAATPVRTGATRAGIRSTVGRWLIASAVRRLTASVHPDLVVSEWIAGVADRHHMFDVAYEFGKRNLEAVLTNALDDLIREIFGN